MLLWDPENKENQQIYIRDMNLHVYKDLSYYFYYEVLDAIS